MLTRPRLSLLATAALAIALPAAAQSNQCLADFEAYAAGTTITTQYPGVTFSRATGSAPVIQVVPAGNTASGTKALITANIATEFECSYLVMNFALPQSRIQFSAGVFAGCATTDTIQVRWFNSGGTQLGLTNIAINGTLTNRALANVLITTPGDARTITRVEVQYGVAPSCPCAFEMIDDLRYDSVIPPAAVITAPTGCASLATSSITIRGTISGGPTLSWVLEYAGGADQAWHAITTGTNTTTDGILAVWPVSALPACTYALRLRVTSTAAASCTGPVIAEAVSTFTIDRCPADINNSGGVSVQDLFDYLDLWFAGCP